MEKLEELVELEEFDETLDRVVFDSVDDSDEIGDSKEEKGYVGDGDGDGEVGSRSKVLVGSRSNVLVGSRSNVLSPLSPLDEPLLSDRSV